MSAPSGDAALSRVAIRLAFCECLRHAKPPEDKALRDFRGGLGLEWPQGLGWVQPSGKAPGCNCQRVNFTNALLLEQGFGSELEFLAPMILGLLFVSYELPIKFIDQ